MLAFGATAQGCPATIYNIVKHMAGVWGPGQPSGALVVVLGQEARSAAVSSALDLISDAATDAEAALKDAQDILSVAEEEKTAEALTKVYQLIETVKSQVPTIRGIVNTHAADMGSANARIARLQQELDSVSKRVVKLEAQLQGSKRRILLGEAAFTMDQVAYMYVFGESRQRKGMTVGELRARAHYGELSAEQQGRWSTFCSFMQQKGWSIADVCVASTAVKEMRKEDAHATIPDKEAASLSQLQHWAKQEAPDDDDVQRFLQLLSMFGEGGKPLVPKQDLASVIEMRQ